MRVGLREHQRDAARDRREPDRAGHVAAAAEHGVGAAYEPAGGRERGAGLDDRAGGLERVGARDALDLQRLERVAGGGHQLGLRALAAGEADVGALSPQRVGDRDRRNHVAGGSARRDHDSRARSRPPSTARRCAEPPDAMLSSSPMAHSSTISDVEPEEMNGSGTPVSGARPSTA